MLSLGGALAARLLQLVLGFINILLISRYLGPQQYGNYTVAVNFVLMFVPFIDLSLNHVITREITQNGSRNLSLIKGAFLIRFIVFLILLPVIYFSSGYFTSNGSDLICLILVYSVFLINYCFSSASSFFIANYQLEFPSAASAAVNIVNTLSIVISVYFSLQLWIILLSQAFFPLLGSLIIFLKVQKVTEKVSLTVEQCRFCLNEVKYLALAGIFVNIYFRINSSVVFYHLGAESAGLFNAAYKFTDLLNPFISVLMMTFFPMINEIISGKENNVSVNDILTAMLMTGALFSIIVFSFPEIILKICYGDEFKKASSALRILSLAYISIFSGNVAGFLIVAHRMQRQYFFISVIAAVFNITALSLLIPVYGITGAAVTSAATEFISLGTSFLLLIRQKCYFPESRVSRAALMSITAIAVSSVNLMTIRSSFISFLIVLLFAAAGWKYRVIAPSLLNKILYGRRIGYNTNS
ncbi:MAG: oligosaccharide flippase family protein [Bacillota bacterium]